MGLNRVGDETGRAGWAGDQPGFQQTELQRFWCGWSKPFARVENFFQHTASQNKQRKNFPINRDSLKPRSVLWARVGTCGFKALSHLPGHILIAVQNEGPPAVYGGKARERLARLTD